ncbi:MAG: hypothetical protein HYT37_02375 [Candidatus Sungbacteria bacterium]|nr:hypothetical protein [Candidatus Sungbacteria bacterium]
MAQANADSSAILQEILGEVDKSVSQLQAAKTEDIGLTIENLQKEFDSAAKIQDKRMREARIRVLTATFEELQKQTNIKQDLLAKGMFALEAYIEKFGDVFKGLGEPSAEDKNLLQQSELEVKGAEETLEAARYKTFFKGRAIANAETELESAKGKHAELAKEVQMRTRQKLLSSTLDELAQQFLLWSKKTGDALEKDISDEGTQIDIIVQRKTVAVDIQKQATQACEKLGSELKAKEADLKAAEDRLTELESGTSEFVAQGELIGNLRSQVEDLGGRVNNAMILSTNKSKYVDHLVANEIAHRKIRANARALLTILRSSSEERIVLFKSRLELAKKAADQELGKQIHTMGNEMDMDNLGAAVAYGAASDRLINDILKALPGEARETAGILAAQAEAHAQTRRERQDILAEIKERFGVDLSTKSFYSYVAGDGGTEKEPAKPEEANTF